MNKLFILLLLFSTLFSTVSAKSSDDSSSGDVLVDAQSNNSTLQDIKVGGETLVGFASDVYEFYVELPQNTTVLPPVEFTLSDDSTQKGYLTTAGVEGDTKITVMAEDGSTAIYTIHFSTYKSSNAALSNIYVNDAEVSLDEFDDNNSITVDVAPGASLSVTYERGDEWQSVAVADAGYNGSEILVVAQDGTTNKYYINYNVLPDTITELSDIQIYDGSSFESVVGFSADVEVYSYELAWKTATVPAINPVLSDKGQTALVEYGAVNDTTFITVTAEDGETTQVYKVVFPVEKSTVSTLSQIYVDGVASLDFESTQLDYYIDVPYGTTQLSTITWDLGEEIDGTVAKGEVVAYNAGNIFTPSTVTVLAEDGVTSTVYTINYNVAYPANDATLSSIYVDGVELSDFNKDILNYSIQLPYGTTDFPAITYSKSSSSQSVLVKKVGGINGQAEITVLSNNSEGDEVTYVVDFSVSETVTTTFTSVMVDGVGLSRFEPTQSAYIIPVTSQPTITYTYDNATLSATVLTSNTNMYQVKVYNQNDATDFAIYSFYYHYTSDVIPNANFEDWTTAKYNSAAKPTSWAVPADGDDSHTVLWNTYKTGSEVTKSTKDGYAVKLSTIYEWNTIAGSIPGLMTLGSLSLSLKSSNNSTLSCSGSIDFRNTPDNVYVDYKSAASTRMDNWRLLVTMGDGSTSVTTTYNGDFDDTSNWRSLTQPISYGSLSEIKKMNIIINSAETENPSSMATTAGYAQTSTLYVDNLAFQYSNLLSAITIDGQAISGFSSTTYSYTVARDADAQGVPTVAVTGAVADQEHQISISDEDANRSRVVTILSIAEDGSEVTYTVNVTRAQSSNTALNNVTVNNIPLSGLGSTISEYNFTVEALNRFVPNMEVEAASEYQIISYTVAGDKVSINVTAEDGTTATYVINLVEDAVGEARLTNITVGGHSEMVFNAATNDYAVTLEYGAVLPAIEFEKMMDTQSVLLTVADTTTLLVTAQDGVTTTEYRILFDYVPFPASGVLTDIKLNDVSLSDFVSDNYTYQAMADDDNLWQFTAGSITDRVSQLFTYSSLELTVEGDDVSTSTYTVALTHTYTPPSSDASLTTLQLNGEELSEFSSELYNYEYTIERGDYPSLLARSADDATLSVEYTTSDSGANEFVYTSTSEDANNSASTTVAFTTALNTEVALSDILINGASLQTLTDTYSASADFDAEVVEYDIVLFSETPKILQPSMPLISYVAGAYGQSILLEKGELNTTTSITVTSESGATRTYELNFTAQKSSDASLLMIYNDGVAIDGFNTDSLEYYIDLPIGTEYLPEISVLAGDDWQTTSIANIGGEVNDTTTITVVAEDGVTTRSYIIYFTRLLLEDNTLQMITLDGDDLVLETDEYTASSAFDADVRQYTITLPVGSRMPYPTIGWVESHYLQTITSTTDEDTGSVTITVTPEDTAFIDTYQVDFIVLKSENDTLSMIAIDEVDLQGFSPSIFDYTVDLPATTTEVPVVEAEAGDQWQTVGVTQADSVNGKAVIDVVAEDAQFSNTYTIQFNRILSDVTALNAILLDGIILDGFDSSVYVYDIMLPIGSTKTPIITVEAGDVYQIVSIDSAGLTLPNVISVTAENGDEQTYTINFTVEKSHDATLQSIFVGGETLVGFDSNIYNYVVQVPYGSVDVPIVSYSASQPTIQTVTLVSATSLSDTTSITVVAEDDTTSIIYNVAFEIQKSSDVQLNSLGIGDSLFVDFNSHVYSYVVMIPSGTAIEDYPTKNDVIFEKKMEGQVVTVEQEDATEVIITVTAEDGTQATYTIVFELILSSDASLSMIYKDEVALDGFSADVLEYYVTLPIGTEVTPEITVEAGDEDQTITIVDGGVNDTTTITIVAEDGVTTNVYKIYFARLLLEDNTLQMITLDGDDLVLSTDEYTASSAFDAAVRQYTITLPAGSQMPYPTVGWVESHNLQTITSTINEITGSVTITVTPEDTDFIGTYKIDFVVAKSHDATLQAIFVDGVALESFDSDVYEYEVTVPEGTVDVPVVTYMASLPLLQTVTIVEAATLSDTTYITVVAEDATTIGYKISFTFPKSDNSYLSLILLNGFGLQDFSATTFEYTYYLYIGEAIPEIMGVKSEAAQTITYSLATAVNETSHIYVTAEDGSVSDYSILFKYSSVVTDADAVYSADAVTWSDLGNGNYLASSAIDDVKVMIYTSQGVLLRTESLSRNEDARLTFNRKNAFYVYVFVYKNQAILSGKFIY
ncbi:MAG: hypothetical protein R3Y59_04050 [bacterium]